MKSHLAGISAALILSLTAWSPPVAAQQLLTCPPGQSPSFAVRFASLQERLGPIMGDSIECERTDPVTGNTVQQTTTGMALYEKESQALVFTNGREHWALTPDGFTHWYGWHGESQPFSRASTQPADTPDAASVSLEEAASVEAVTIMGVFDDGTTHIKIRRDEDIYLLDIEGNCTTDTFEVGGVAFLVSPLDAEGRTLHVILTLDGSECRIRETKSQ
jgi:hypothetical protein